MAPAQGWHAQIEKCTKFLWQLDRFCKWSFCFAQLHPPERGWTNVSLLFNDWDVCRITTYLYYGQLGPSFYLRESLCCREEVLSAPRISSFWKRSVSLSFLDVFFLFVLGWCVFWGLFLLLQSEDIRLFAFHLFSYNLRTVDPTTRRFDDRQSLERARHELKKKDTFKEGRATKRRRKDGPFSKTQSSSIWDDESNASESTAELLAGREVLRAGSTHWELVSLFHFLGDYQCFAWLLLFAFVGWGGFCCFCLVTGSPLFRIWCTRSSCIPRLSPSSWWAQHRSQKKISVTQFSLKLFFQLSWLASRF